MTWRAAHFPFSLGQSQITLWCISISEWEFAHTLLQPCLSAEEQARANRFKFERHQRRFRVTRGVLRLLLGQVLGVPPLAVPLTYSPQGKPQLADNPHSLQFNLSHSQEQAIYALAFARAIGVDIEYLRPIPDLESLVKRFFSPQEADFFQQLPPSLQTTAFFRAWTQKEAYLKAIGTGLAASLDQVEVSLAPHGPAALRYVSPALSLGSTYQLLDFIPADNYIGALAVETQTLETASSLRDLLQCYRLNPQDFGFINPASTL